MKIVFTAAEQTSFRNLNKKLADLIGTIPGCGKAASAIREQADEPIDFKSFARKINSEQVALSTDESGDLVLWINPETVEASIELAVEQYSIGIEIACALYPVFRLAKRLFAGFAEKMNTFAKRFEPARNPLLGTKVTIYDGADGHVVYENCEICVAGVDVIIATLDPAYSGDKHWVAARLVNDRYVFQGELADGIEPAITILGAEFSDLDFYTK